MPRHRFPHRSHALGLAQLLCALLAAATTPACTNGGDDAPSDQGMGTQDGSMVLRDGAVTDQGDRDAGGADQGGADQGPSCGNGVRQGSEECDGADRGGATCATETPSTPVGQLGCVNCMLVTTDCRAPTATDMDADDVVDDLDPEPSNPRVCGDSDTDGCDDCSLRERKDPANDGYDPNGDGDCELALDYACMNGANAASDPYRTLACVTFAHINNDRAHFAAESGNAAPLVWNEDIWEVAVGHSRNMCNRGIFAHDIDGVGPSDRATAAGLGFSLAENISANLDPGAAEYGWMEEPTCRGHRGNNLSPKAFQAAVGYHICDRPTSEYQWGQHHHITTDFRRNNSTPSSAYCMNAATDCEIPPNPPTTATCPQMLINWGFCPVPSAATLSGWGCPSD
ncbi:MAG: CAP domain-containing protein [Myxococcales bacterium]|nr:CAP domain-containing protein [Myxococcales bacterium]